MERCLLQVLKEENQALLSLFEQYDMDHDGFISMEENLEQDKVIADEQGKPFDEVQMRPFCHKLSF